LWLYRRIVGGERVVERLGVTQGVMLLLNDMLSMSCSKMGWLLSSVQMLTRGAVDPW
jgi:hypothetical protein